MTVFASLAFASAVLVPATPPSPAGPIARAAAGPFHDAAPVTAARSLQANGRDSLTNGSVIGAVVGGLLGAAAGVTGCGYGSILEMSEDRDADCTGPALIGGIAGAALGSLLGAGVDALFERAPSAGAGPGGVRKGVRIRWRF